ncbi:CDP-alcohol phosphatidyltransferase family protein [Candidatus Micrarchaeota archaeon]|nr:CDP-alcohol phosphatidyltransferase family protein [Candidatus Micrarchaeota archaeon]
MLKTKDFVTLANAASGMVCIALSVAKNPFAWVFIPLAVVFDWLDGKFARKSKADNAFGKQLDSLADAVSFAVAPVSLFLVAQIDLMLLAAAIIYVSCGLVRLAKFNIQEEKGVYYGLTSPGAALGIVLVYLTVPQLAVAGLVIFSLLMVAPFKWKKPHL